MLSGFLFVWPIPFPEHFSFQLELEDGGVFRDPTLISSSTLCYNHNRTPLFTNDSIRNRYVRTDNHQWRKLKFYWRRHGAIWIFGYYSVEQFLGLIIHVCLESFLKNCWDFTFDLDINDVGTMSRFQSCPVAQRPRIWRCPGAEVAGSTSFCYQPYKPYKLRRTVINMYTIPHLLYLSFCLPLFKNRVRFGFR